MKTKIPLTAEAIKHHLKEKYGSISNFCRQKNIGYDNLQHLLSYRRMPAKELEALAEELQMPKDDVMIIIRGEVFV